MTRVKRHVLCSLSLLGALNIAFMHIGRKMGFIYLPSEAIRRTSIYLGNGNCRWQPANYIIPDENFHKTLIAGYPSGDKRLIFAQMEALTGLPTKDEWDFSRTGITNEPFIKVNYPHHEGIWSWQQEADQVVLVLRNIRRSMVEYHDRLDKLDPGRQSEPLEDFLRWRDERLMEECHWYGWYIDYYMEDGLMRDIYTHKLTTAEHWNMLMHPESYKKENTTYDLIVGENFVPPTYDPHCLKDISNGCIPVAIISAERLVDHTIGKTETQKIANVLKDKAGVGNYLIDEEAWDCIWTELIINKKGHKTYTDWVNFTEKNFNFSEEILQTMLSELNRLISKYSDMEWQKMNIAVTLVELLTEHRGLVEQELQEVRSGKRKLKFMDFLGPETRKTHTREIVQDIETR